MPRRRAFTDAETWAMLTAPETESGADLARRLGCNEQSVRVARARLRREGWTCRVAYRPCHYCGLPFTVRGVKAGRAAYHPECHRLALVAIGQRNAVARWERTPDTERLARLERAHRHSEAKQAATRPHATNHGHRWTDREDARLRADDAPPRHVLALELGRSLHAVAARLQLLRKRHNDA